MYVKQRETNTEKSSCSSDEHQNKISDKPLPSPTPTTENTESSKNKEPVQQQMIRKMYSTPSR